MVSASTPFAMVLVLGVVWSCKAIDDRRSSSFLRFRSGGHSVMDRAPPTNTTNAPSEVDKMLDSMSEKAKAAFPEPIARPALEQLSSAYGSGALNAYLKVDHDAIDKNMSDNGENHMAGVYGELLPQSVLHMFALAAQHNPNLHDSDGKFKPGHFYDMGSGLGKTVVLASLLGFEGDGIELTGERFSRACRSLGRLGNSSGSECGSDGPGNAKFVKGSFVDPKVELSDADIVFTDSVYWTPAMMETLAEKASKMKPGSIIVSYKPFPGNAFKHLDEVGLETSWSKSTNFGFQQVKNSNEA